MEVETNYILKDRTFKGKSLGLPKFIQLNISMKQEIEDMLSECSFSEINGNNLDSNAKHTFILDHAKIGDLQICETFAKEAAVVGDNVGEDEFGNGELFEMMHFSEVFVIECLENRPNLTGNILAFIVLQPYWGRIIDTCQTTLSIYYDQIWFNTSSTWSKNKNFTKEILYATLTLLAIKLAKDIQIGYTDALTRICSLNVSRLSILQNIGFHIVACVPNGISINGNLVNDFMMMKNFSPTRMPRSMVKVTRDTQRWCERDLADKIFDETSLLEIPFLPFIFKSKIGKLILIRSAVKSDMKMLYDLFQEVMSEGSGYGLSEYPTFSFFRVSLLITYNIVYEIYDDELNADLSSCVVGCSLIQPSLKVRSKRSNTSESAIVISKKFRSLGLGKEFVLLERYLIKKLGFKFIVNEYLECNQRMSKVIDELPLIARDLTIGVIPRAAYTTKHGWVGQIVLFLDLKNPAQDKVLNRIEQNISRVSVSKL